jgi:hypothetical protein
MQSVYLDGKNVFMVKFIIKTGFKHLNKEARLNKQPLERLVKGMYCKECRGIHTIISFKEIDISGVKLLRPEIVEYCRPAFRLRLIKILMPNKELWRSGNIENTKSKKSVKYFGLFYKLLYICSVNSKYGNKRR